MQPTIPLLLLAAMALGSKSSSAEVRPTIDIQDRSSQEQGLALFIGFCQGCHSARFMRYSRIAEDLQIPPDEMAMKYIKDGSRLHDPITAIVPAADLEGLFGVTPPDLSLEARYRGEDWLYSYLTSFYPDATQTYGFNNRTMPGVNMPWVLHYHQSKQSPEEFSRRMVDLTNFMAYMAEPIRPYRESVGKWVLLFLGVLLIPVYLLKQSYWRELH